MQETKQELYFEQFMSEYKDVISCYEQFKKCGGFSEKRIEICETLGKMLRKHGRYSLALYFFDKLLEIRCTENKIDTNTELLYEIGHLFKRLKNYQEALRYYQLALQIAYDKKDKDGVEKALNEVGLAYGHMEDHHTGGIYMGESERLEKSTFLEFNTDSVPKVSIELCACQTPAELIREIKIENENGELLLDGLYKLLDRHAIFCPCGARFVSDDLKMYDHDDGLVVSGYEKRQWVYLECNSCKYGHSFKNYVLDIIKEVLGCYHAFSILEYRRSSFKFKFNNFGYELRYCMIPLREVLGNLGSWYNDMRNLTLSYSIRLYVKKIKRVY